MGVCPNTACHSLVKSSPPDVGAFNISLRSAMSSLSESSCSRSSDNKSLGAETISGVQNDKDVVAKCYCISVGKLSQGYLVRMPAWTRSLQSLLSRANPVYVWNIPLQTRDVWNITLQMRGCIGYLASGTTHASNAVWNVMSLIHIYLYTSCICFWFFSRWLSDYILQWYHSVHC